MHNPMRLQHDDHMSIFGDTHRGVPSPNVPHVHPYPTRYHGPIWSYPTFGQPYQSNPYAAGPSYMGFGSPDGLGSACGCKGMGASPDGLGEPLLCASSGNSMVDIALGAVVGVLVSRTNEDRVAWGLAGAAAGWLGGLVGIVAVGGTGLYLGRR